MEDICAKAIFGHNMENISAKAILGQMFRDGFPQPDLKITTPTRTFDVHKSVVCEACPFFKAACDNDWKEARTRVINLPEDEVTVSEILEHCYGTRPCFGEHRHDQERCSGLPSVESLLMNFHLLIAAGKYQVGALCDTVMLKVFNSMESTSCTTVVEIGVWVYQEDRRRALPSVIVKQIVRLIAEGMQTLLMEQPKHWSILQECPELLKDVVSAIAKDSNVVQEYVEWEVPEYLQVPDTDMET